MNMSPNQHFTSVLPKQSLPSLPALPGPLWPGVVAPDRVLSMDQMLDI